MVPVPGRAAAALGAYLQRRPSSARRGPARGRALPHRVVGPASEGDRISFMLRRHASAAGLAKVHPHALRHACATHLLKGGADVRHVQAILGHKKLETTALYTRVVIEDLREVLAAAHPRERPWLREARRYNRPLRSTP